MARVSRALPVPLSRTGLAWVAALARHGKGGRMARENLTAAFGSTRSKREIAKLQRGVFRHTARMAQEWMRLGAAAPPEHPSRAGDFIDELVELDSSVSRLTDELARGRGAIIVTAHLGNWELLAARLRRLGLQGAVIGRRRPKDPSARWFEQLRLGYGVQTLSQEDSPRRILEVLRSGGTLGMLCDFEVRRLDGEFLDFFGRPALFMTAPAALARAHGVPLIPVRCTTLDARRYRLRVEPPLELRRDLDRRAATRELLTRLARIYEGWIRAAPCEWAWHQNRWRTREGEYEVVPMVERRRRGTSRQA